MHKVDQLNTFYLGKTYQGEHTQTQGEYVLFPHKQLTTHAFCVGMTGSGKTGLCLTLLEEAALDGIPAILVDPKGDLANLLLQFPQLEAKDFLPWLREDQTQNFSYAEETAKTWREGLSTWGIFADRIEALTDKVSFELYTPGSTVAKPLSIASLFELPPLEVLQNPELLQERVSGSVLALLNILGVQGDPFQSKEFVFLSNVLGYTWVRQERMDLGKLILAVQNPPFQQLGVMPLESFYPEKERFALAMKLNTLLASPKWSVWLQGEALDIKNLLYTPEGKAKMSILSLAHLNDQERMFFVSLLSNQMVSFMRTQGGTSSLRALFYMDEIYGYLPPVENPPSKAPLLTLLKQARAFGIGLVLATQNPVDLDYKALANCGTWWIGRLQTERDRARVLAGMDMVLEQSSASLEDRMWNKAKLEEYLTKLPQRVFIQHSVHQSAPILLQTRFCMSYLAGPLSRDKLSLLSQKLQRGEIASSPFYKMNQNQQVGAGMPQADIQSFGGLAFDFLKGSSGFSSASNKSMAQEPQDPYASMGFASQAQTLAPKLPPDIPCAYLPLLNEGRTPHYKAYLYGRFSIYYKDAKAKWQSVQKQSLLIPFQEGLVPLDFEQSIAISVEPSQLSKEAQREGTYQALPTQAQKATQYVLWKKAFLEQVYRKASLNIWHAPHLKIYSKEGETEAQFRIRLQQMARERLDEEVQKIQEKHQSKLLTLEEKIRKAAQTVEREKGQAKHQQMDSMLTMGASIFSVLLGGGKGASRSIARAGRSVSRASKQQGDVKRSEESYQHYVAQYEALEQKILEEITLLREKLEEKYCTYEALSLSPAKKDVIPELILLVFGE